MRTVLKRTLLVFLAAVLFVSMFCINASAAETFAGRVTASTGLSLRIGPGINYTRIVSMPHNASVTVYELVDGWYKLSYGGKTGYASGEFIETSRFVPKKKMTSVPGTSSPAPETTIEDWHKVLVNPWNYLPKDFTVKLSTVYGYQVDSRCAAYLNAMMNDCWAAGYAPLLISGYRDNATQTFLYNRNVNQYLSWGYNYEDAKREAGKSVAVPGTSEHQLGLAVDIVDMSYQGLDYYQMNTGTQQWLMANSWKYGFILRYPLGKTDITGIIFEPWHYRYVGYALAKDIYESGLTFEEYLEQMEAEPESSSEPEKVHQSIIIPDPTPTPIPSMVSETIVMPAKTQQAEPMPESRPSPEPEVFSASGMDEISGSELTEALSSAFRKELTGERMLVSKLLPEEGDLLEVTEPEGAVLLSEPDEDAEVIFELEEKEQLTFISCEKDDWYKVKWKEHEGYVLALHIAKAE